MRRKSNMITSILIVIGFGTMSVAMGHDLQGLKAEHLLSVTTTHNSNHLSAHLKSGSSTSDLLSSLGDQKRAALKSIQDHDHALVIASSLINDANSGIYNLNQADKKKIEAVILRAKTWNPGSDLKVCFYEKGGEPTKSAIAKLAQEWANHGNIKFDFGKAPDFRNCSSDENSNIRVTFRTEGYWSLLGTDSMYDLSIPSMGLENFDSHDPKDPEFITTVLHEFGHAVGFHHEHQTPAATCESQINKDKIKKIYKWDDEDIRVNFQKINVSSSFGLKNGFKVGESSDGPLAFSSYDPKSVMHYSLPFHIFNEPLPETGSCFIKANRELSQLDIEGMKAAYPAYDQKNPLELHRQAVNELIHDSRLSSMQKAAFSVLQK